MDPLWVLQADSLRMMKDQHLHSANEPVRHDPGYPILTRSAVKKIIIYFLAKIAEMMRNYGSTGSERGDLGRQKLLNIFQKIYVSKSSNTY